MSSETIVIGQDGKSHKLDAPRKHAGLPTVPYGGTGGRRNSGGDEISRLAPQSVEHKSSNLKLPRTLAASKGCLVLMPEPEDGWLFGKQSTAFKTTPWSKRKNMETMNKEETLKALTATILEYGPDAKHFVDFLQSFAKSNDADLLSKPGSRPNDYLKGLQKQLGLKSESKRDNFHYTFQNLQLDVDQPAARTPNILGRISCHNLISTKTRNEDNLPIPSADFSSADTYYKNCTLFIPHQLAEGSKFMRKLHMKDGEVVKYPISAGKMIEKLLFQDSPEELERRAFDERYELSSALPDVSILSTTSNRKGAVRFDPNTLYYTADDLSTPWGVDAAIHGSLASKDREDGASSAPLYREKGGNNEDAEEASGESSYGSKSDKYGKSGYLKRTRKEQPVLLRNRNNLNLRDAVKEMIQEKVKLQPIYEYNYQVDKTKDVRLMRKDAEDLIDYVTQWTKEQNERAIEEAKRMVARDDSSDDEYSEGNRSRDRRSKSVGSKSSSKEDTEDKDQFRDCLLKSLRVKSPKKKKSEERRGSTIAKTLISDDSDEGSDNFQYNYLENNFDNGKYDLSINDSTRRTSRTIDQPKSRGRTLTTSKMVKPKKKSHVEKIQNIQTRKQEDPTVELTISEKILKFSVEKQQKIMELELKQETLEMEIRTLVAELEKIMREIAELDKLIGATERDLTDDERDAHDTLKRELEERLEICRLRLEAETKSLWDLRRERALIERQMLFDDLEDEAKREEFSANQDIQLEEREITEESEMEEAWERQRKRILEDYEKQRSDLESSLASTRFGKMTPLSERRSSLEEKRLDLSNTIDSLKRNRDAIGEEMNKVNEWYEEQLQQLKQELEAQERLQHNSDQDIGSLSRPKSATQLALEKAISDVKRENMYRDRLRQTKSSKLSKAFIYSYFSNIPQKVWMKPMTKDWAKMIQAPSYSSAPSSAKGKTAPAPGDLKRSKTNKF